MLSEYPGRPPSSATAPPKGSGMQLGKTKKTNQLMNSLKAEGEVILEDVPPVSVQTKSALPPTDPITLTIEEKLNVIIRRDGGISNFDVQGTLSVQILNQDDGLVQFQVLPCFLSSLYIIHTLTRICIYICLVMLVLFVRGFGDETR